MSAGRRRRAVRARAELAAAAPRLAPGRAFVEDVNGVARSDHAGHHPFTLDTQIVGAA